MRKPLGYATILDPDAPMQEYDTTSCAHCSAIIFTKPGTVSTVYLTPGRTPAGVIVWQETPGAGCYRCGYKPVCLACHAKGTCQPLEHQLARAERHWQHSLWV